MHPNDNRGYLSLRDRVIGDFFPLYSVYVCECFANFLHSASNIFVVRGEKTLFKMFLNCPSFLGDPSCLG